MGPFFTPANISDLSRSFGHIPKTIWELSLSACLEGVVVKE